MNKKSLKLNTILNIIKTISSMCFPLITFPYISRVIQSTNYGKVNFGNSIISYFSLIAAFGIITYAIREGAGKRNNKKEFICFANQIFTINIITTIISYIMLIVLYILWPKLHDYSLLLFVQSFSIIFTTIGIEWIYSIHEDYFYITVRSILVQVLSLISLFIFVKQPSDYIIYAGISVFANGGANIFNFWHASKKYCTLHLTKNIDFVKHIKPMAIIFFSNVAISFYANSDITILGILKDDYTVGIYSFSVKIYTIIKQLISSILVVVLPRLSFYKANYLEKYNLLLNNIKKIMLIIIVPTTIWCILLSSEIILILSGQEYLKAQSSLSILCLAFIISAYSTIYGNGVLLLNKEEKKIFLSTIIGGVTNVVLNILLIPKFAENAAAFTTIISELIVLIINYKNAKKYIISDKSKINIIVRILIGVSLMIVLCIVIKQLNWKSILTLITSVISSAILYGIIMIYKNPLLNEIKKDDILND